MVLTVSDIEFGDPDGSKESTYSNFEELFYQSDNYFEKIKSGTEYVIEGRKGTGKTVLIEYFKKKINKEKRVFCELHNIQDFMEARLKEFDREYIDDQEMETFWRYVLLKELSEMLLSNRKLFSSKVFKQRELLRFVETSQMKIIEREMGNVSTVNRSFKGGAKVNKEGILLPSASGGKEKSKSVNSKDKMVLAEYYHLLGDLHDYFVAAYHKKDSFYLIYDDVDELEDKVVNRESFYCLMKALLNTSKKLNAEFRDRGIKCKIIIAIRKDIVKQIHKFDSNSNKVASHSIKLDWYSPVTETSPHTHPIAKLLLHKIRISSNSKQNDEDLFTQWFAYKGRGSKNIFSYLMKQSFGRPRDIVKFVNLYCQYYPNDQFFDFKKMVSCLSFYSEWFYTELENEIAIHENRDDLLSTLDAIKMMGKSVFTIDEIETFYKTSVQKAIVMKIDIKQAIEELYMLGAIGNNIKQEKRKPIIEFIHRNNISSTPNFTARQTVHYGLRPYLGLT